MCVFVLMIHLCVFMDHSPLSSPPHEEKKKQKTRRFCFCLVTKFEPLTAERAAAVCVDVVAN